MTIYRMHVKAIMLMIVSYLYLSPDVFGQSARVAKPPKNTGDKLLYKAGDSNFIIGSAQPDTLKGVLFGVVSDTGRSSNKHNFGAFLLPRIDSVHIQRHLATKSVATQGSLLYDSVKKAPRYFDGKTWQTLLSTARQPIYTSNDSLTGDRTVTNRGKKLVFTLDTINTKRSSFSIGQKKPIYPVEIATTSYIKSKTGPNSGADSVALRISHNVMEGKTSYGLLLNERSNKATGRSAIGFMGGNDTTDSLVKARIWAQQGFLLRQSKFGIDVANQYKILHTRMVIDSAGQVGIGLLQPTARLHVAGVGSSYPPGERNIAQIVNVMNSMIPNILVDVEDRGRNNYLRVRAGGTTTGLEHGGIWLTKHDEVKGFKIRYNANADRLEFLAADNILQYESATIGMTLSRDRILTVGFSDGPLNSHNRLYVRGYVTGHGWTSTSDSVLKRDVHSLGVGQSQQAILALHPVTYYFKGDTVDSVGRAPRLRYGFIAQEVARTPLADLVSEGDPAYDPVPDGDSIRGVKGIDYTGIIAPLVAFSQALYKDKEALRKELRALQAENKRQAAQAAEDRARVEALEKQIQAILQRQNIPSPSSITTE